MFSKNGIVNAEIFKFYKCWKENWIACSLGFYHLVFQIFPNILISFPFTISIRGILPKFSLSQMFKSALLKSETLIWLCSITCAYIMLSSKMTWSLSLKVPTTSNPSMTSSLLVRVRSSAADPLVPPSTFWNLLDLPLGTELVSQYMPV